MFSSLYAPHIINSFVINFYLSSNINVVLLSIDPNWTHLLELDQMPQFQNSLKETPNLRIVLSLDL